MKNLLNISILFIMAVAVYSCGNSDADIQEPIPMAKLNSISPESGKKGTVVTINGTNFGTNQNTVSVFFNDKPAQIQSITNTEILAIVPSGALTGLIKVIVDNTELTGPEFTYVFTINVSTLAGGTEGFADGVGTAAKFFVPRGITTDSFGNIYVADRANIRIRKITPDGTVSTIAGNGTSGLLDGEGINANFFGVEQVAIDKFNNIYITDQNVGSIRKINASDGLVSTTTTGLISPKGIVVDDSGIIYVADFHKLLKIDPNGTISTLAGSNNGGFADGIGTDAKFENLTSLTMDASGIIYGTDRQNHRIRKIAPNGVVSTLAGSTIGFEDGIGTSAQFSSPTGITIDPEGNLFVVDTSNHSIRKITPEGLVSTLAGSTQGFFDGEGTVAQFNKPRAITIDSDGNLYITDTNNASIRKITFE